MKHLLFILAFLMLSMPQAQAQKFCVFPSASLTTSDIFLITENGCGAGSTKQVTMGALQTFLSANLFNQTLNTTDNVQFNGLTATGVSLINANTTTILTLQGTGSQLVLRGRISGNPIFQEWRTFDNIRRGFLGFPASSSDNMQWTNETLTGSIAFLTNSLERLTLTASGNIGLRMPAPFANTIAGVKVVGIGNVSTIPTGTVTDGGLLYMSAGQLHNLDAAGVDHDLTSTGTLFISTADAVVANTVVETTLISSGVGSITIPAASLNVVGMKYLLSCQGIISDTGNPTAQFRITLGGVLTGDSGTNALGSISNDHWILTQEFVVRTIGVTGTIIATGGFLTSQNDHFALINTTTITIDTTVDQTVDVTMQWGTASASNTVTAQICELHEIKV